MTRICPGCDRPCDDQFCVMCGEYVGYEKPARQDKLQQAKSIVDAAIVQAIVDAPNTATIEALSDIRSGLEFDDQLLISRNREVAQQCLGDNYALLYAIEGVLGQDQNAEYELESWYGDRPR